MLHGKLLPGGFFDQLGNTDDVAPFVGREPQTELLSVRDDVEHPAVRNIDGDRAQLADFDFSIQMSRERGDVEYSTGDHASRFAAGVRVDGGDHLREAHEGVRRLYSESGYDSSQSWADSWSRGCGANGRACRFRRLLHERRRTALTDSSEK